MAPSISEIRYKGNSTTDFVEIRVPQGYPDPENLVIVIYDKADDGTNNPSPNASDFYSVTDGQAFPGTPPDGNINYVFGSAYSGDSIALHANDAVGLFNSFTGETYGLYSFGDVYTVSTAAVIPGSDPPIDDPFAGVGSTALATNTNGQSLTEDPDNPGEYIVTTSPTPGTSFPCFCWDTEILTPYGPRKVQELKIGDLVVTKDNGLQKICWVGQRHFKAGQIDPRFRPIKISAGSFGPNNPRKDLYVSPNHTILQSSMAISLMFSSQEALIPSKGLLGHADVNYTSLEDFTYIHILFDEHQLIKSNGMWTESLFIGDGSISVLGEEKREEIFTIFPELRSNLGEYGTTARLTLRMYEAQLLTA